MPRASSNPTIRPLISEWVERNGRQMLALRDPLNICSHVFGVPPAVAVLLSLCDGTRTPLQLSDDMKERMDAEISPQEIIRLLDQFEEALLLEGPRFELALAEARDAYRGAPYRPAIHAGPVYPENPEECAAFLESFGLGDGAASSSCPSRLPEDTNYPVRALLSPHIDYARGGRVYSQVWKEAADSLKETEVIVVFGTDHAGTSGSLTPTLQSYATPFGVLETDRETVETVARAIGEEVAFAQELHHRGEHSIELALVWIAYYLREVPKERWPKVVPILVGSYAGFVDGTAGLDDRLRQDAMLGALETSFQGKRTLAVAAADLSHVGPEFGDEEEFGPSERAIVREADEAALRRALAGDSEGFLRSVAEEDDRFRVCGLGPLHLTLRFLRQSQGRLLSYDQCPADAEEASWVSIAGALFY